MNAWSRLLFRLLAVREMQYSSLHTHATKLNKKAAVAVVCIVVCSRLFSVQFWQILENPLFRDDVILVRRPFSIFGGFRIPSPRRPALFSRPFVLLTGSIHAQDACQDNAACQNGGTRVSDAVNDISHFNEGGGGKYCKCIKG